MSTVTDGTRLVSELINLHDSLEASRGVPHLKVKELRKQQTARYWELRGQIAKALDASEATKRFYGRESR